jgi:hypothetical protein
VRMADAMANLILLHPICHQQLHAQTDLQSALRCCTASSVEGVCAAIFLPC